MAALPSQHPTLSLHLADDALTPLITSSRSRAHLESLTSLATSALSSQTAAQRVGMGAVERIMVEYPGAVVLQTYLQGSEDGNSSNNNRSSTTMTRGGSISTSASKKTTTTTGEGEEGEGEEGEGEEEEDMGAPRLVGVVVAGRTQEAGEAKRAAARLERVGREFQSQWAASE